MNEIEWALQESGHWNTPIGTDRRGRAIYGRPWAGQYFAAWVDTYWKDGQAPSDLESGTWVRDDNYRYYWATDTPEFDREWFRKQGVKPPQRIISRADTQWRDHGGGLSQLAYKKPPRKSWRARLFG